MIVASFLVTTVFAAPESPRFVIVSAHEITREALRDLNNVGFAHFTELASGLFALIAGPGKAAPTIGRIEIRPGDRTVIEGEVVSFTATAFDGNTPIGGVLFTWSIADIDRGGPERRLAASTFEAKRPGRYIVKASAGGRSAQIALTVREDRDFGTQGSL